MSCAKRSRRAHAAALLSLLVGVLAALPATACLSRRPSPSDPAPGPTYDETGTELRRTRAIWLGAQVIAEYESTDAGSNWALAREFVWGAAFPEPVAMIDYTARGVTGAGQAEPFYYVRDRLGSVVALTDASGTVVERYTYEPYGTTLISNADGSAIRAVSAYGNPFGFTGQRYDAAVGLYHFRHRSYSPRMGRWLQPDPAGYPDGVNLFEYVRSNPIMGFDPWGLEATDDDVEALIGGYGGGTVAQKRAHYADTGIKDPRFPTYEELRQAMDWAAEKAAQAAQMGIPIVGDASDLYSALTGKDLLTGDELSAGSRVLAGVSAVVGSKRVAKALEFISNKARRGRKCVVAPAAGAHGQVGGHHLHAKAGFMGHPTYDPDKGFSISQEYMRSRNWDHSAMTAKQRQLFDELSKSGRPNTLKEHTRIAVEALEAGGGYQGGGEDARCRIAAGPQRPGRSQSDPHSVEQVRRQMTDEALDTFGKLLMCKVRDASIADWRQLVTGAMRGERARVVQAQLSALGPEHREVLLSMVPKIVDTVLHHVLWMFEDASQLAVSVQLEDGNVASLRDVSDGLCGELYGDNGWVARFSEASAAQ